MAEAAAVSPEGRISARRPGLWSDAQAEALRPCRPSSGEHGAAPAVQLAHAGRKASTAAPGTAAGPWASPRAAGRPWLRARCPSTGGFPVPREMTRRDLGEVTAVRRRRAAGPLCRVRGGRAPHGPRLPDARVSLAAVEPARRRIRRIAREPVRLPLAVGRAVREAWPARPSGLREDLRDRLGRGRMGPGQSIEPRAMAQGSRRRPGRLLQRRVWCNRFGPRGPGLQTPSPLHPAARRHRHRRGRLHHPPEQAETILATGQADAGAAGTRASPRSVLAAARGPALGRSATGRASTCAPNLPESRSSPSGAPAFTGSARCYTRRAPPPAGPSRMKKTPIDPEESGSRRRSKSLPKRRGCGSTVSSRIATRPAAGPGCSG